MLNLLTEWVRDFRWSVDRDAAEPTRMLSQNTPEIELRNWLKGLLAHNSQWGRLVRVYFRFCNTKRAQINREDVKRIPSLLEWELFYRLSHSEIILTDQMNNHTIAVACRSRRTSNVSPLHTEMYIVWRGHRPSTTLPSGVPDGFSLVRAEAMQSNYSAIRAGFGKI